LIVFAYCSSIDLFIFQRALTSIITIFGGPTIA
jgi:hypothetical protein